MCILIVASICLTDNRLAHNMHNNGDKYLCVIMALEDFVTIVGSAVNAAIVDDHETETNE